MKFEQLNNKEFLTSLLEDGNAFKDAVRSTKGFVLEKMKNFEILPSAQYIIDNISVFSLNFLTKNYKLSAEQSLLVSSFVNPNKDEKNVVLNQEQIIELIENNKELPSNVKISKDMLFTYPNYIYEHVKSESLHKQNVVKALSQITSEEILSLDKRLFELFIREIGDNSSLFTNSVFREQYKNNYLLLADAGKLKLSIYDFKNYVFSNDEREFLLKLLSSEDSYHRLEYSQLVAISGVKELIDKKDYFLYHNMRDVSLFSPKEFEENLPFIKSVWADSIRSRDYDIFVEIVLSNCSLDRFLQIVDENFIKESLPNKNNRNLLSHVDTDHNPELVSKIYWLRSKILSLFSNSEHFSNDIENYENALQFVTGYEINKNINELLKTSKHTLDQKLLPQIETNKENVSRYYQQIAFDAFSNDKLLSTLALFEENRVLQDLGHNSQVLIIKSLYENFLKDQNSVNSFYTALFAYYHINKSNILKITKEEVLDDIRSYIYANAENVLQQQFDKKTLLRIVDFFDNNYPLRNSILYLDLEKFIEQNLDENIKEKGKEKSDEKNNEDNNTFFIDDNLFSYNIKQLKNLNKDQLITIYGVKPELLNDINQSGQAIDNGFIYTMLKHSKHSSIRNFLKVYAQNHKELIEKNEELLKAFLTNQYQGEIFPKDTKNIEIENLDKAVYFAEKREYISEQLGKIQDKLKSLHKSSYYSTPYSRKDLGDHADNLPHVRDFNERVHFNIDKATEIQLKIWHVQLYEKAKTYENQFEPLIKNINHELLEQKVYDLIGKKQFFSLFALLERSRSNNSYIECFSNYVNNSSFSSLKADLDDPYFLKLMTKTINYDNKTSIAFKNFSYEESSYIAQKLMPSFASKDTLSYVARVCHFFKEHNLEFIKPFAIEHLPLNIAYTFDFEADKENSINKTGFITEQFTDDEVIQIFRNCEKQNKFFGYFDVNARYSHLIDSCFFPYRNKNTQEEQEAIFDRFLKFCERVKVEEPKLYTICISVGLRSCTNLVEWDQLVDKNGNAIKYRDQHTNYLFDKFVDLDILLDGMKKIIEEARLQPKLYNTNLVSELVTNIVSLTFYEIYDNKSASYGKKASYLDDEQTHQIFKAVLEVSPTHLVERTALGCSSDIGQYISQHIDSFYSLENVDRFILPNTQVMATHLSLKEDSFSFNKIKSAMKEFINAAIEKNDYDMIDYLKNMAESNTFLNNEFNTYRSNNKEWEDFNRNTYTRILELLRKDNEYMELLKRSTLNMKLRTNLNDNGVRKDARKKI